MDNYDAFKNLLDSKEINYKENSFGGGERYVTIPQRIKSGGIANFLVIFYKTKIKLLVVGIASMEDDDKLSACYELFNRFNLEYSFFKMYIRQGNICVESDFSLKINDGEFVPEELMDFIGAALFCIEKVYRDIMKIQLA